MLVPRLCARRIHAVIAARGPAMHHRVGDIGMALEAKSGAVLDGLVRKVVAFGEPLSASRQFKPFAMPVIDALRPIRAGGVARRRRADWIIANLGDALRMQRDLGAELH